MPSVPWTSHSVSSGVFSQVTEVEGLSWKAKAGSIPFKCVFFFNPTLEPLSQRWAVQKQFVPCAHKSPMLCLYRHLWLPSDTAHNCIFLPGVAAQDLVLHCGWIELDERIRSAWLQRMTPSGNLVAAQLSQVWDAFGVPLEKTPTMATATLPGPLSEPLDHLCISRSSLFQGPGYPRLSAMLCDMK